IRLFQMKVLPIATYDIEYVWDYIPKKGLRLLDKVKTTFLKRTLGVSKYSKDRLIYLLVDCQPLTVDIKQLHSLPETLAYLRHKEEIEQKQNEVPYEFYSTPAMTTSEWKNAEFKLRHCLTRHACHGFHYKICAKTGYHQEAFQDCRCKLCDAAIGTYHLLDCPRRTMSLSEYSQDSQP